MQGLLLEALLAGAVLALACWELYSVHRSIWESSEKETKRPDAGPDKQRLSSPASAGKCPAVADPPPTDMAGRRSL